MSNQIVFPSGAFVVQPSANRRIVVIEYLNPEILLTPLLAEFLQYFDFIGAFPQMGQVRVGAVHPFAAFLLQTIQGQEVDLGILPAITISDTSDAESAMTLSRDYIEGTFGQADIALMMGYFQQGILQTSATNMALLQGATANNNRVAFRKRTYTVRHNVDFNIWTANKDVTSLLYEICRMFFLSSAEDILTRTGLTLIEGMTGRRSGDINVEFGRLLFGANVTAPITSTASVLTVDIPIGIVHTINAQGTFFGGV